MAVVDTISSTRETTKLFTENFSMLIVYLFLFFWTLVVIGKGVKTTPSSIRGYATQLVKESSFLVATSLVFQPFHKAVAASTRVLSQDSSFYVDYPYLKPEDILPYIDRNSKDGDVNSVIDAMSNFATYYPMYALSPLKAGILENTIKSSNPAKILEIGTFFGFSALHVCRSMSPKSNLICIEGNEDNARVAREIIKRAFKNDEDVLNRVKVVLGLSNVILDSKDVQETLGENKFDFVFLDHDKDCYLPDLRRLESKDLLNEEKCTLIADNVIYPGAPDFLRYVNTDANRGWKTELKRMPFERKGYETKFKEVEDAMSISIRNSI